MSKIRMDHHCNSELLDEFEISTRRFRWLKCQIQDSHRWEWFDMPKILTCHQQVAKGTVEVLYRWMAWSCLCSMVQKVSPTFPFEKLWNNPFRNCFISTRVSLIATETTKQFESILWEIYQLTTHKTLGYLAKHYRDWLGLPGCELHPSPPSVFTITFLVDRKKWARW